MPPPPRPRISFVLVEPRQPGNVGAACRAIKNGGFDSLRLVNPPELDGEARKMAWKSLDVLRSAKRFDSVDAAVEDAVLVAAFTARPRRDLRDVVLLEDAVPRLLEAERTGRVCLLFGREDRGLTKSETDAAQFLVNIPAARERQVYNLSQAVLLAAYQLRAASTDHEAPSFTTTPDEAPPLTAAERRHLVDHLRDLLVELDYENHPDPGLIDRITTRMARLLDRAEPTRSDQAMLMGVLRRVRGSKGEQGRAGESRGEQGRAR